MQTALPRYVPFLLAAASAFATGCSPPESPELAEVAQEIGGVEGMLEYAIDAPWRMEPDPQGGYGAIPIQLSLHDADITGYDTGNWPDANRDNLVVSRFCDLTVREYDPVGTGLREQVYRMPDLEEIERSYRWLSPSDSAPGHSICRPSGEDCTMSMSVDGFAEWHASAWYTPVVRSAGADVVLEMEARFSNRSGSCLPNQWGQQPHFSFKNYARVHLGEAPLPRFDRKWIYGDLHYHSQGTDNEGESGYNFRGVVRAMGALGLDFAFATEHASNGHQVMDLDVASDWQVSDENRNGLRDMSDARFRFLLQKLTQAGGVNREAALRAHGSRQPQTYLSHDAYPQLFLGGELDAIPEMAPGSSTNVAYGNGLVFDVRELWDDGPMSTPTGRLVLDKQGWDTVAFGREHLVYLPRSSANTDAFIPSDTSHYGGATRRLAEPHEGKAPLLPEIEAKGYAFLAHHLNHSNGGRGPGSPPWSDFMLDKAWRSPGILGLQFWNEPVHLETEIDECPDPLGNIIPCEDGYHTYNSIGGIEDDSPRSGLRGGDFMLRPWRGTGELRYEPSAEWGQGVNDMEETLHHGAASWDRLLLKGLDPRETSSISWLAPGEPRRFFMAGGSDAHGDLNYRREGYMTGTEKVTDVAIAKARNLVLAGAPDLPMNSNTRVPEGGSRHSQEQVVSALKDGHFLVTDGPILRIGIDRDRDGVVEEGEAAMGDIHWTQGETELPILIEWESTAEFGNVETVDLYVGVASADGAGEMRVYAPPLHGPRTADLPGQVIVGGSRIENGVIIEKMADGYYKYPSLKITNLWGAERLKGSRTMTLQLDQFPTAAGRRPDRLFVRAFARTAWRRPEGCPYGMALRTGECINHYAFTNPVWAIQDLGWQADYKDPWTGFGDSGPWNAGDVNGDHRLDLIHLLWTAPGSLRAHTLLRSANGTWTQRWSDVWPGFGDSDVRKWRVADVTGDGNVDLVHVAWSASTGIRVHTLIADGNGGWNRIYRDAWPGFGLSDVENWRVADVSGDGKVDLVHLAWSASSGIRVHTLVSNGNGTWTARYRDAWPGFGDSNVARWRTADVDGNGRADLVHVMKTAQGIRVHALRSNDDGSWSMAVHDPWPGFGATDVDTWRVSDVDGNGRTDLVHMMWTAPGNLRVHTLLATEGGGWEPQYQDVWSGFGASDVASWRVADADGDGRSDLVHVMWSAPGNLRVHTLLSHGSGRWRATYRDVWQGFGDSDVAKWRVTDIDGDHAADLFHVAWSAPGNLRVHTLRSLAW
jgi:hypothetical protein